MIHSPGHQIKANEEAGIQAVPAENKHDLNTVFRKFDKSAW